MKKVNPAVVAMRMAKDKVDRERTSILIRCSEVWAYSMIQCGLDVETVRKVKEYADGPVTDKILELRKDGVADDWLYNQLSANGIHFPKIEKSESLDF